MVGCRWLREERSKPDRDSGQVLEAQAARQDWERLCWRTLLMAKQEACG